MIQALLFRIQALKMKKELAIYYEKYEYLNKINLIMNGCPFILPPAGTSINNPF